MPTFAELSKQSAERLKSGALLEYIQDLKQMAEVLNAEGLRMDELKVLMLAFCFSLNCTRTIDAALIEKTRAAVAVSGMTENEMEQLYLDTIRPDTMPYRFMCTWDSLFVLNLCIDGREAEARKIVAKTAEEMQNLPDEARKM